MDSEMPYTFSFGHYHQAPGASCSILYILVLSLVLFMQSLYHLSNNLWHLLVSFHFFTAFSSENLIRTSCVFYIDNNISLEAQ